MQIQQSNGSKHESFENHDSIPQNVSIYRQSSGTNRNTEDNPNIFTDEETNQRNEEYPNYVPTHTYSFENSDFDVNAIHEEILGPRQSSLQDNLGNSVSHVNDDIECPLCDGTGTIYENTDTCTDNDHTSGGENYYKAVFTCKNCGGIGRVSRPTGNLLSHEALVLPVNNNTFRPDDNQNNSENIELSGIGLGINSEETLMRNGMIVIVNDNSDGTSTVKDNTATTIDNTKTLASEIVSQTNTFTNINANPAVISPEAFINSKILSLASQTTILRRKSRHLRMRVRAAFCGFGCCSSIATFFGCGCFGCCGVASTTVTAGGIGSAGLCGGCSFCALVSLVIVGLLIGLICCIGVVGIVGIVVTLEIFWPGSTSLGVLRIFTVILECFEGFLNLLRSISRIFGS